jgi:organic hydroperoxide reductase OsmC/OhrA
MAVTLPSSSNNRSRWKQPKQQQAQIEKKLEEVGEGFSITRIELETEADISGIDDATFQKYACWARMLCCFLPGEITYPH